MEKCWFRSSASPEAFCAKNKTRLCSSEGGYCCCHGGWEGCGACRCLSSDKQVLPLPVDLSLFLWLPDSAMCRWLFGPHEL